MTCRIFRRSTFVLLLSGCAVALCAIPVVGCSSDPAAVGGDGGTGGTGGTGATGGTGGNGGTMALIVDVCATSGISTNCVGDVEGVSVCEDGTDNCALTDASGSATIMLPAERTIAYTMTKEGYLSYLEWDVTDETFAGLSTGWPMFTEAQVEDLAEHLGIDYPLQGSFLIAGAVPFRAGVTFRLVGETATSYYADEDGVAQLDLTETTSNGRGGFLDIPPGEHEIEFMGAVANCTSSIAPHSDTPNRITVTVREGFHTYASMNCDMP